MKIGSSMAALKDRASYARPIPDLLYRQVNHTERHQKPFLRSYCITETILDFQIEQGRRKNAVK